MREVRGLKHDDSTIIAEKALRYKNKKKAVFSKVSSGNYTVLKDYSNFPVVFLDVDENSLASLLNMSEVSNVSEDKAFEPHLVESLPLIRAPQAHLVGATGSGTSVAVLDTGVNYTLPAFGSCTGGSTPGNCTDEPPPPAPAGCNVVCVHDFTITDDGYLDADGHGTNVSGIVAGVAPDTGILGLDVFSGTLGYPSTILDALDWVIANQTTYNIVAVNMSFSSGRFYDNCPGDGMATAIAVLKSDGITSVVSSKQRLLIPQAAPRAWQKQSQ
jgi:subtilisin family serine protease